MVGKSARQCLDADGYVILPGRLDQATLHGLRGISAAALASLDPALRERTRSQGSLVPIAEHPDYAALLRHPAIERAFGELGITDPRFSSGYLISKPPGGPPLFWHQDWWAWDEAVSYTDTIAQLFVMIYLSDTTPGNGCLRTIPGTHRRRHALHDAPAAHGDALSRMDDPDDPLFGTVPGEVDVPVRAGDLVIGDARLLHAAHANRSENERGLITLWFHPTPNGLPATLQARIRALFDRTGTDTDAPSGDVLTLERWPDAATLSPLFPDRIDAAPHPMVRKPEPARFDA